MKNFHHCCKYIYNHFLNKNLGRECVAVTVFADEEYLVSKNRKSCNTDHVQFWLYDNKPERYIVLL